MRCGYEIAVESYEPPPCVLPSVVDLLTDLSESRVEIIDVFACAAQRSETDRPHFDDLPTLVQVGQFWVREEVVQAAELGGVFRWADYEGSELLARFE